MLQKSKRKISAAKTKKMGLSFLNLKIRYIEAVVRNSAFSTKYLGSILDQGLTACKLRHKQLKKKKLWGGGQLRRLGLTYTHHYI